MYILILFKVKLSLRTILLLFKILLLSYSILLIMNYKPDKEVNDHGAHKLTCVHPVQIKIIKIHILKQIYPQKIGLDLRVVYDFI